MTINQLIECVLGKEACFTKKGYADATPFTKASENVATKLVDRIRDTLPSYGFSPHGWERMYNGMTGEMMEANIFIGPTYYQRLKHMVNDKMHARAKGHVTILTRQPLEGRARDGGFRFGEMERDCMIGHGCARFTKERLHDVSDPFQIPVCKNCKVITNTPKECQICKTDKVYYCTFPYASKLLHQELTSMGLKIKIKPDTITDEE
jgi:DNA-directed RNA polymerase II subunit RPB2